MTGRVLSVDRIPPAVPIAVRTTLAERAERVLCMKLQALGRVPAIAVPEWRLPATGIPVFAVEAQQRVWLLRTVLTVRRVGMVLVGFSHRIEGHQHGARGIAQLEQPLRRGREADLDGVIIAAAFLADTGLGIVTALAIIAHEIPQEVGDYLVLRNAGFTQIDIDRSVQIGRSVTRPCSDTTG